MADVFTSTGSALKPNVMYTALLPQGQSDYSATSNQNMMVRGSNASRAKQSPSSVYAYQESPRTTTVWSNADVPLTVLPRGVSSRQRAWTSDDDDDDMAEQRV